VPRKNCAEPASCSAPVADEVSDAIYVKDRAGKYLLCNKAAARLTGTSARRGFSGRDATAVFDPEAPASSWKRDRRVMATGVAETEEIELTAAGVTQQLPYDQGSLPRRARQLSSA